MAKPFVACTQCGTENELTSLFCSDCGAKLDLTKVEHGDIKKSVKKERGVGGNPILKLIRLVVVLALIALIGVMLWPPVPGGEVGEKELAGEYESVRQQLIDAAENGREYEAILPERAINAYAMDVVAKQGGAGFGALSDVNISIIDKEEVEIMATMKFGPVPLVYVVLGRPTVGPSGFDFAVDQVQSSVICLRRVRSGSSWRTGWRAFSKAWSPRSSCWKTPRDWTGPWAASASPPSRVTTPEPAGRRSGGSLLSSAVSACTPCADETGGPARPARERLRGGSRRRFH